jgi:hypothetical protein
MLSSGKNIFDYLHVPFLRDGMLTIIEKLAKSQVGDMIHSSNNEVARLVELLQSNSKSCLTLKLEVLKSLGHILSYSSSLKDVFRDSGGFVCIIYLLITMRDNSLADGEDEDTHRSYFWEIMNTLTSALSGHEKNRQFFQKKVGYKALEDGLLVGRAMELETPNTVFGMLFGLATESTEFFVMFQETCDKDSSSQDNIDTNIVESILGVEQSIAVRNPDAIRVVFRLHHKLPQEARSLQFYVHLLCYVLCMQNIHNQFRLSETGLTLSMLQLVDSYIPQDQSLFCERLEQYLQDSSVVSKESVVESLSHIQDINAEIIQISYKSIQMLFFAGVGFEELRFMFGRLRSFIKSQTQDGSDVVLSALDKEEEILRYLDVILYCIMQGRSPNFFRFNISDTNYGAIHTQPNSEKVFPPQTGFSFSSWVRIKKKHPVIDSHLFTLTDLKDNLVYCIKIEALSGNLSIFSHGNKESIRIFSSTFKENNWYHIVVTHQKAKNSNGLVVIYIDGVKQQQHMYSYPSGCQATNIYFGLSQHMINKFPGSTIDPDDKLLLDIGPTYIFEDILSPRIVSTVYHVGPHYKALFQTSVDNFLNNEYSDLSNPEYNSKVDDELDAVILFDQSSRPADTFHIPESKILFMFNAENTEDRIITLIDKSSDPIQILDLVEERLPGTMSIQELQNAIGCPIKAVFNTAFTSYSKALSNRGGVGKVYGNYTICCPSNLSSNLYRVGGCLVALSLIEASHVHP